MRALVHPAGPSQARCRRPGLAPRAAHRRPCRSRAPPERSHTAVCRPARARTQRRPAAARPRPRRAPRRRVWHPSAIFAPQICRASRAPSRTCALPRRGPRRSAHRASVAPRRPEPRALSFKVPGTRDPERAIRIHHSMSRVVHCCRTVGHAYGTVHGRRRKFARVFLAPRYEEMFASSSAPARMWRSRVRLSEAAAASERRPQP